jgi:hypothetical protein
MAKTVADKRVETLTEAGAKGIHGIVGDSLYGLRGALRRYGIIIPLIALLPYPAISAKADTRNSCNASELANARLRWEATRRSPTDSRLREKNCRAYEIQFYEAATARQAASACRDGIDHQRDLELLDAEIDAFNKSSQGSAVASDRCRFALYAVPGRLIGT